MTTGVGIMGGKLSATGSSQSCRTSMRSMSFKAACPVSFICRSPSIKHETTSTMMCTWVPAVPVNSECDVSVCPYVCGKVVLMLQELQWSTSTDLHHRRPAHVESGVEDVTAFGK